MTDLRSRLSLDAGRVVDLFTILDEAGAVLHRFTPDPAADGSAVRFAGHSWDVQPIGVAQVRRGRRARPELRIGRADGAVYPSGEEWNGYRVRRWRTLDVHLDGGSAADTTAVVEASWWIESWKQRSLSEVVLSLSSPLDLTGLRAPTRQVLRDQCSWTYRRWDGTKWISGTCPYAAAPMWTANNVATNDKRKDSCARTLTACELRYPTAALPWSAYPGVAGAARPR